MVSVVEEFSKRDSRDDVSETTDLYDNRRTERTVRGYTDECGKIPSDQPPRERSGNEGSYTHSELRLFRST